MRLEMKVLDSQNDVKAVNFILILLILSEGYTGEGNGEKDMEKQMK